MYPQPQWGFPQPKNPAPHTIDRPRVDTSLGFLTQRFADMLQRSANGKLDLNTVAEELSVPKRRLYDVTNVLEGISLIQKTTKNQIEWLGGNDGMFLDQQIKLLTEQELVLDSLITSCRRQVHHLCANENTQRFAYLTYDDVNKIPSLKEQTVIVIKAPAETKLEVPHPEESLQVHLSSTQGPIEVFLCSEEPMPMDTTDSSMTNGSHWNSPTSGKSADSTLPQSSCVQVSSTDNTKHTSGVITTSSTLAEPTQHTTPGTVPPQTPTVPTSLQPPSDDQQNFVNIAQPLSFQFDGEDYVLSLGDNEGISDLFSNVDLTQLSLDIPIL